jgi:hypothetical protein
VTFVLAGTLSVCALTPALAAKAKSHAKATGACAQSSGRCISDCDALNWCTMNTCVNGQSTPVPFWRCFEPSGLCLAPHC